MREVVLVAMLWSGMCAAAVTRPSFFGRYDYPGSSDIAYVLVADVNGDRIADVIELQAGVVQTLLGNGNGTFRTGPVTPGWQNAIAGFALDLNGDGKVDLIIDGGANGVTIPSGIGVCFGNGDGTFQAPVLYRTGNDSLLGGLAVGDFNGDGIPDVAVTGESGIWLFLGQGGGVFNQGVLIPIPNTGAEGEAIVAGDFNGDGKLDLAVGYYFHSKGFMVFFGNGNGTFGAPAFYSTPSYPHWIAVGDVNGDGHLDLVIHPDSNLDVFVYLNNGSGGFSTPLQTPLNCYDFALTDINGDGILDLVSDLGYISPGVGNGTFGSPIYFPMQTAGGFGTEYNVVPAYLRKKGLTDLVIASSTAVSVLLNQGKGTFIDGAWMSVPGSINCGAAADFNLDGKPDVAVATTQGVSILLGTGKAAAPLTAGPFLTVSGGAACPITGDVNGDGIPDLLFGGNGLGGVGVYLGNGDGTFRLASVVPVGPGNLVLGDFNHDGKLDFADSSNQLALGNGDGTFQPPVTIYANLPVGMVWIASGDVNNDGWTDLVYVGGLAGNQLYTLLNNQKGGFTLVTSPAPNDFFSVMLADLNGDGKLDAVAQSPSGVPIPAYVYLGNGQGQFTLTQSNVNYPGPDPLPPQIGDVNGDGIPDLLLPADGSIAIALGLGNGVFSTKTTVVGTGPLPGQILFEYLHGQSASSGKPDLVAPDSSGGVIVLINTTK